MITYALKYHILTYLKFHKVVAYEKIVFHLYLMCHICDICMFVYVWRKKHSWIEFKSENRSDTGTQGET